MSVDNPYYFYNENKSPKTPDSSSKGFSFFRRRNSKGGSSSSNNSQKFSTTGNQSKHSSRTFNSATLSQDAAILGSPRGSLGSLGSFSGATSPCFQSFELQQYQQNGMYKRLSGTFRERLGSYNESLSYSENDDVFLQTNNRNNTTRTLPTTTISNPNRRHSLGHLTSRERTRCNSFTDEVPKMIAPKPPAVISPMKYRVHRRKELYGNSNMDDILIITTKHSERAILWANFLKNRFDKITKQRGRKPFNFLHIKIDEGTLPTELTQKCLQTALQIVILCPAFISLSHSYLMTQLSSIINPDKVLGIMLEIPEDKILEIHKTALPSFRKWKKCSVRDNDHSLIGNILGIATDILGRALCQRPPCQENNNITTTTVSSPIVTGAITSMNYKNSNTDEFTVVPRKVKIGQNKILILLNEPLIKDDWIKILIEKSGEFIMINNYRKRNPYTIQFNIPESCMEISTMIEIHVEKNEKHLGSRPVKCESRLRELEQLLRTQDSPIEFMCHSLGIGSTERDALDLHLLQCFQKNTPPNFHLLTGSYDCKQNQNFMTSSTKESKPEEFPTLLHFAAKWGFERLCLQLLECPGGDAACEMKNCTGKTPAEIAEHEGYHNIAKSLKSFSQIHEFATMYHYFKGISDSTGNNKKVVIEPQILTVDLPPMKPKSDGNNALASNKQQTIIESLKGEDVVDKSTADIQAEYMEMNSGSDDGDGRSSSPLSRPTTLAVTNLNYINVETQQDDCNLESFNKEFEKKFQEIKIIEDSQITSNELRINEPPYYQSTDNNNKIDDEFSKECSNVLENCSNTGTGATEGRAISSQLDYILQPSNIPVTENVPINLGDYMIQPSNRPVIVETNREIGNYMNEPVIAQQQRHQIMTMMQKGDDSHLMMNFEKKKPNKNGTLKRTGSDTSSSTTRGNADDELAEIMYDFKNNVLTIREVEQLVEKWKNRNDVKQSFKEKQEQIEKLREEYERVQEQMKAKMKRPTPFERVKKLFSRNKQNTQQQQQQQKQQQQHTYEDTDDTKSSITSFHSSQRPMSTLSLQSVSSSSSSSGRMSTVSACSGASLGDSGTHSDHEDRRQIFNSNCRIGLPGSLMVDNYMIPPAPRPVLTPTSTPTPIEEKDRLIFTTAMVPNRNPNSPNSPTSEHYIIFPSNVPVINNDNNNGTNEQNNICHQNNNNNNNSSNNSNSNNNIDSLPFCGLNTIIETKETVNDTCISINNNINSNNDKNNGVVIKPIKVQNHDINYTNSNIKHAYNTNNNNNENFSTFKPLKLKNATDATQSNLYSAITPPSPSNVIDVKKEMSEVYQNINGLNDNKTKLSSHIIKVIQNDSEDDCISSRQNNWENANTLINELITDKSNNNSSKNITGDVINKDKDKNKIDRNYMNI